MADLYGNNAGSSSLESEEMSSFLHNLLHNSFNPSNSTSCPPMKDKNKQPFSSPPPAPEATSSSTANLVCQFPNFSDLDSRFGERGSTAGSSVMVDASTGFTFSDPGRGFLVDARDCPRNKFPSVCAGDSVGNTSTMKGKFLADSEFDDFGADCKGLEASEAPENPCPPRSSKRSRAAEFHNLSEKRRRSRINEKLKALQNLIPNSNKTDKASMLDEAIEYLKQLQVQVQMLSLRNGLGLHPFCLPGSLHTQLPLTGLGFSEGNEVLNTNRGEEAFSGNQEISFQAALDLQNQCTFSNHPNPIFPMANIANLETTFGLEPSIQNQCGPFSHLTSSKELCREDRLSQLQLDMSCSGKNSSSGVSS